MHYFKHLLQVISAVVALGCFMTLTSAPFVADFAYAKNGNGGGDNGNGGGGNSGGGNGNGGGGGNGGGNGGGGGNGNGGGGNGGGGDDSKQKGAKAKSSKGTPTSEQKPRMSSLEKKIWMLFKRDKRQKQSQ